MTAFATASPAAYQQQSIMTAPPERLVVMLYDGAMRFFFQAAAALREDARTTAFERLEGVYVFCKRLLMEARLERDADKVDLVRGYLAELREAWSQLSPA
jgi:flagellar secretion chaperone FliS